MTKMKIICRCERVILASAIEGSLVACPGCGRKLRLPKLRASGLATDPEQPTIGRAVGGMELSDPVPVLPTKIPVPLTRRHWRAQRLGTRKVVRWGMPRVSFGYSLNKPLVVVAAAAAILGMIAVSNYESRHRRLTRRATTALTRALDGAVAGRTADVANWTTYLGKARLVRYEIRSITSDTGEDNVRLDEIMPKTGFVSVVHAEFRDGDHVELKRLTIRLLWNTATDAWTIRLISTR